MAIKIICGHIRNGKTLFAMRLMEQAVEAGRPVYTNIMLTDKCPWADRVAFLDDEEYLVCGRYPKPWEGLKKLGAKGAARYDFLAAKQGEYSAFWHYVQPGSVVVIDEADAYLDCTDHTEMGKDVKQFHKQVGKFGTDLIYIVQHVPNLYVRIRRLAESFTVCEWNYRSSKFLGSLPPNVGRKLSRWLRSEFCSDQFDKRSHMGDGYWKYDEGAKYFGWYRTAQLLGDTSFYRRDVLRKLGLLKDDDDEATDGESGGVGSAGRRPGEEGSGGVVLAGGSADGVGSSALEGANRRLRAAGISLFGVEAVDVEIAGYVGPGGGGESYSARLGLAGSIDSPFLLDASEVA